MTKTSSIDAAFGERGRPTAEWVAAPIPEAAAALTGSGVASWFAPLLARRGAADPESARRFLEPSLDQLHDPYLLEGMDGAVDRLLAARRDHESVAVVGDYDVDGVTATAMLLAVLRSVGMSAHPILPHRLREGYGFQPVHAEKAKAIGCSLIVTADCGSSSLSAIEAALGLGIDVLVTDHHLPQCELPAATLHLNPRLPGSRYPCPDLAAVGLALKLCTAFAARCAREIDLDALLRIACLGTIADLVPLCGENRIIAALGLKAFGSTRSKGLKALLEQSGVKLPLTAADVGFRLGPRINAAGRLDAADRALELLLARDMTRASELAAELEVFNRQRQSEETRVVEEALRHFESRRPFPNLLVASSPGWHKGVVGIAAGRIAKELRRPTILLAEAEGKATGSGRSLKGIELHAFLSPWKEDMLRFGGHSQAIGLTVETGALPRLREEWEEAAAAWPADLFTRRLEYELTLAPSQISHGVLAELERLAPFGQGNPRPLVRSGPFKLSGTPRPFGRGHLAATVEGERGARLEVLGWGWAERARDLTADFEALGYLETDAYRRAPVLQLVDSRPAGS